MLPVELFMNHPNIQFYLEQKNTYIEPTFWQLLWSSSKCGVQTEEDRLVFNFHNFYKNHELSHLPVKAIKVLESSAKAWRKIKQVLSLPVWQNTKLPMRWVEVRDSANVAADNAMLDLLEILDVEVPKPRRKEWRTGVIKLEDTFYTELYEKSAQLANCLEIEELLMQLQLQLEAIMKNNLMTTSALTLDSKQAIRDLLEDTQVILAVESEVNFQV